MILADVMQQLADRLDTIPGLRTHGFPADSVTPPAAVVGYPETYNLDGTYARGMDRIELPIVVLVAKPYAKQARDKISGYASGAGPTSVKAVLESAPPGTYTAFDSARVMRVEFDIVQIAAVEYLAATFTVDIAGPGGSP